MRLFLLHFLREIFLRTHAEFLGTRVEFLNVTPQHWGGPPRAGTSLISTISVSSTRDDFLGRENKGDNCSIHAHMQQICAPSCSRVSQFHDANKSSDLAQRLMTSNVLPFCQAWR